jgi:hypothetical protein
MWLRILPLLRFNRGPYRESRILAKVEVRGKGAKLEQRDKGRESPELPNLARTALDG